MIAFEYSDKHKEFVVGVKSNLRLYLSFSVCPQEWSYLILSQHITIYQSNRKKQLFSVPTSNSFEITRES